MNGDKRGISPWIRMRIDLGDDPAVILIAGATGLDQDAVVGKLHRLWSWATKHLSEDDADSNGDPHATGVRQAWVDEFVKCPGFASAMVRAGWLRADDGGIVFPKWGRYLSEGSKARALAARRAAKHYRQQAEDPHADPNATSVRTSVSVSDSVSVSSPPEEKDKEATDKRSRKSFTLDDALAVPVPMTWDPDTREAWGAFVRFRWETGKRMTANAVDLNLKTVDKMQTTDRAAALLQSVANGWTGVFPVSKARSGGGFSNDPDARREQRRAGEYQEPKTSGPRIIRIPPTKGETRGN
jgi:hypothetical protein